MTPYMVLETYRKFIQQLVKTEDYRLKRAPAPDNIKRVLSGVPPPPEQPDRLESSEMVLPHIGIGSIPHANFDPYDTGERSFQSPYAIVGMGEYVDDYDDASMPVLIQVCCYSEIPYEKSGELKVPDNLAYLDVINFLTFLKFALIQQRIFGEKIYRTELLKPMKMGTYADKQYTYPFAFGYLLFDTSMPSINTAGTFKG